jgi:phage terminase large subunit-like protein
MGRRWGKTILGGAMTLNCLRHHGRVAWIVPEYKNGRALWRYAANVCAGNIRMSISKSERVITTDNGGFLAIYSADNIDSIRSESFHLVVRDEAARQSEDGLMDAVIPTLADTDGSRVDISTPIGKNYYYYAYMAGAQAMDKECAAWNAPSSDNPSPNIRAAYERVKGLVKEGRYPERSFKQEWDAEFVADGAYFVNIEACTTAAPSPAQAGRQYVIGVDWARSSGADATVMIVMDSMARAMVHITRMVGQAFDVQLARLRELHKQYNDAHIIAEYNSMGGPLVERLQSDGLPVHGFVTTLASKHDIITALGLALENKTIALLDDATLITELNAYEKKDRAGIPSYSAPVGMHDDCVMSLALAWSGIASQSWYVA